MARNQVTRSLTQNDASSKSTRRTSAHRASMAQWALLSSISEDVEDVLGPGFCLGGPAFRRSSAVARAPMAATATINGSPKKVYVSSS